MEQCANTYYLNRYLAEQEEQEQAYEQMLEDLRNEEDEDEYENIIDSYGFGDVCITDIIGDI